MDTYVDYTSAPPHDQEHVWSAAETVIEFKMKMCIQIAGRKIRSNKIGRKLPRLFAFSIYAELTAEASAILMHLRSVVH